MLITIDEEKCKQDGFCADACTRRIIEMKEPEKIPAPVPGAEELCINCGHCVAVCPTAALSHVNMTPDDCAPIEKDFRISIDQAGQFFRARRSIRTYKTKPVEREKLEKLLEISGHAPSGHNARTLNLIVIEDNAGVRKMSEMVIGWMRSMIKDAPDLANSLGFERVVGFWESGRDPICRNAPHLVIAHAPEIGLTPHEDCVLALSYIELATSVLGLGATWAGYIMAAAVFHPPVAAALKLPEGHKCFGAMMLGYPAFKYSRLPVRSTPPAKWISGESL